MEALDDKAFQAGYGELMELLANTINKISCEVCQKFQFSKAIDRKQNKLFLTSQVIKQVAQRDALTNQAKQFTKKCIKPIARFVMECYMYL